MPDESSRPVIDLNADVGESFGAWTMGTRARQGWVEKLPGPLAGWTAHRDFPVPARETFRDRWAELQREEIPVGNRLPRR